MPKGKQEEVARMLQFAEVQMLQAEMAPTSTREALLHEAKDALIRAEHLAPGSGAWKLACINAYTGKTKLCRQWLKRARNAGTLPPSAELKKSPYLEKVRDQKWFKKLLEA